MNHYYRLMVPTTIYNEPAPADLVDAVRASVKLALAEAFGGYTETRSAGGYRAESGELIEETVYQIEASYSEPNDELVWRLAAEIKNRLSQESVMIRKDHKVTFL